MLLLPSLRIGLETMRANPVRTGLSTLGIVMGAASLVGVLSLADGAEAFARRQIELNGLQTVIVTAVTSDTVDGVALPRHSYPLFAFDDARGLARALPRARLVLTVQGTGTFTLTFADASANLQGQVLARTRDAPSIDLLINPTTNARDCSGAPAFFYSAQLTLNGNRMSGRYEPTIGCELLRGGSLELVKR